MCVAVRNFAGTAFAVDPLPEDWEEAKEAAARRVAAYHEPAFGITSNVLARAWEFLLKEFPGCGPEIENWPARQIVEAYLDL